VIKKIGILMWLAASLLTAEAQTVGAALVGHRLNEREFHEGLGAGLWLAMPLGGSKWSLGVAASYTRSEKKERVSYGFLGGGPHKKYRYTNRLYSVSVIAPREVLDFEKLGIALGPSLGFASIGSNKAGMVSADRIFAGLWADFSYELSGNLHLNMILHPRWSPKGNGGATDVYDPFSRKSLFLREAWLGVSYRLGR
jgi:hypothetical protein